MLRRFAEVLSVNYLNFEMDIPHGSLDYMMQMLFWLDEANRGLVNLIQLERVSQKKGFKRNPEHDKLDKSIKYHDSAEWPIYLPMAIWFDSGSLNNFIREWMDRKQELKNGEITLDEYFEWKLNWPDTSDGCGRFEPKFKWRRTDKGTLRH